MGIRRPPEERLQEVTPQEAPLARSTARELLLVGTRSTVLLEQPPRRSPRPERAPDFWVEYLTHLIIVERFLISLSSGDSLPPSLGLHRQTLFFNFLFLLKLNDDDPCKQTLPFPFSHFAVNSITIIKNQTANFILFLLNFIITQQKESLPINFVN